MRPFDDIPMDDEFGDVALLVASVREFPSDEFARELDARVERRFAPEAAPAAHRTGRGRLPRWAAGPAVAVVAGAVAAVVVLSGGGASPLFKAGAPLKRLQASQQAGTAGQERLGTNVPAGTGSSGATSSAPASKTLRLHATPFRSPRSPAVYGAPATTSATSVPQSVNATASAPVAPGSRQILSAQLSLATPNQHVNQVADEVFGVVSADHGSVRSSHITSATAQSGGGYASFSLSIPTSNLQDAMTQLSRLRYASVVSSSDGSQNVSNQYNNDQRQLGDAKALRASLLKQLQTAYTQSAIDSIKAQLKLAERQISSWQSALNALQHRISYSNLNVQINAGGLPMPLAHKSSFTLGGASHDALRVLVVAAGVALIALAVALPVGMVVALLVWLWVWLRQRRREHALDATS